MHLWFTLCIQVVDGAPSPSVAAASAAEAAAALNPFILFGNFKDFWVNIKCIHQVLDEVMDDSDVDDLWHDLKIKMKKIVEIEWKNCLAIDDDAVEQEKYGNITLLLLFLFIIIDCFGIFRLI